MEWNGRERAFVSSTGQIRKYSARFGNIGGEVFTSPITSNGTIVLHHVPNIEGWKEPAVVEIRDNQAVLTGDMHPELRKQLSHSPEASQVGEFGIGLMAPEIHRRHAARRKGRRLHSSGLRRLDSAERDRRDNPLRPPLRRDCQEPDRRNLRRQKMDSVHARRKTAFLKKARPSRQASPSGRRRKRD